MCLYSRQILPRRATKDIVVYKEMIHIQHSDMYKSPFLNYIVTLKYFGDIKFAEGKKSIIRHDINPISFSDIRTQIGSGYFHCHRIIPLLKGMDRYGKYYLNNIPCAVKYSTQWRVIECTIPKGSLYWIGVRNDICSDKLIFNKVLSEKEINQILYNNEKALTNCMLSTTK